MKRMRIMGLALIAMFAMSALVAGAASAALPELGRCVAKAGAKYEDNTCQTLAAKGKGSFDFTVGAAKNRFTSRGGESVMEVQAGSSFICTAQRATGEYKAGGKEVAKVVATFTGCALPLIGAKCNTAGKAAGEIVTNALAGRVGYINRAKKEVGQELRPETKGGLFALYVCGPVTVEVGEGTGKGGDCIIAAVTPVNIMTKTFTQRYYGAHGVQNPQKFEGGPICNLESRSNKGRWERATQALTTTVTNEEALELKA